MRMPKIVADIFSVIIVCFYFFTFNFRFFAWANTKTVMAGVGLVILILNIARGRKALISKDLVVLSGLAFLVSLTCLIAVFYNGTKDYVYASYIISMWVWLSAAYVVVWCLEKIHGKVTARMVSDYLILTSFLQCVIAVLMGRVPLVNAFSELVQGPSGDVERLYGIGCAYDVAGIKFSCVLIIIAQMLYDRAREGTESRSKEIWYISAFFTIAVIGNMIARTTTVGVVLAILYLVVLSVRGEKASNRRLWNTVGLVLIIAIPLLTYLYRTDESFREDFRFGFEGFVSLIETGRWEVQSNDILVTMYRFPETLETWLIGDGYIGSANEDPYYLGEYYQGYYKGTDVGYLRFIYYAGLPFMLIFMAFIAQAAMHCTMKYREWAFMFVCMYIAQLAIWLKVSTDVFLVFALYIACANMNVGEDASGLMIEQRD